MRERRTDAACFKEGGANGGRWEGVWVRSVCVCLERRGVCVCAHSLGLHIWFLLKRIGENSTPEDLSPISVAGKRAQQQMHNK